MGGALEDRGVLGRCKSRTIGTKLEGGDGLLTESGTGVTMAGSENGVTLCSKAGSGNAGL